MANICPCPVTVPDSFASTCEKNIGAIVAIVFKKPTGVNNFTSTTILTQLEWDTAIAAAGDDKIFITGQGSVTIDPADFNISAAPNGRERSAPFLPTTISFEFTGLESAEEVKLQEFLNCAKNLEFFLIDEFGQTITGDDGAGEPVYFKSQMSLFKDVDNKGVTAPDIYQGILKIAKGELSPRLTWDTSAITGLLR